MKDYSYSPVYDYQKYDEIVNKLFINIYSLSKDKPAIIIEDFDQNNKTCLLFFEVAILSGNTFSKEVKLKCSWLPYLWFKLKNKKKLFARAKKEDTQIIQWREIMEWMKGQLDVTDQDYANIYNLYYKKGRKV